MEQKTDGSDASRSLLSLLRGAIDIEASEIPAAIGSFVTFALVLGGYYLIRPVRENISAEATGDQRQLWFLLVFLLMLVAVPIFGWIVARVRRALVLPGIYAVFVAMMLVFWLAFRVDGGGQAGGAFFVFASVFNLFAVSLFWILMSDIYDTAQAKRLYGFIAAGGTAGAILGPLAANGLVTVVGATNLLLIAAVIFLIAAALSVWLRRACAAHTSRGELDAPPTLRTILSGAERVLRDSYLLRIAAYVLLANLLSTFFYLEQVRLAGETIPNATARVQFFAERDLITSALTVLVQVFLAGRVMAWLGLGVAASILPAITIAGLALYAAIPELHVVAGIMVAERVASFALSNPATKVLYTAVDLDERYKAQNFIDTVVYRGGDAISGAIFNGLTKAMGWPLATVALASIPVAGLWLAMSSRFDRALKARLAATPR